jgi:type VI secretion system protein VasD
MGGAGALTLSALSACETPPPAAPEPCDVQIVTLRIYADEIINPNRQERPRPVVVRLYQLVNDLKLQNAGYDEILNKDVEVLGDDMLKKDEVEVFPNDLVEIKFERIPEAFFLGAAAMFNQPQGQSWKTFYEFPPMPNASTQCGTPPGEEDAAAGEAFPETAFFVVERKIDNGSQFDESMFPNATAIRKMHLPKGSAASDNFSKTPAGAQGSEGR